MTADTSGLNWVWSDAVILLAVCMRHDLGGSDPRSILATGDFLARCILTDIESFGGMDQLLAAGHVYLDDGRIFADEAVVDFERDSRRPSEDVEQATERIMRSRGIRWPHLKD